MMNDPFSSSQTKIDAIKQNIIYFVLIPQQQILSIPTPIFSPLTEASLPLDYEYHALPLS
jgi:hypothetical protein